MRNASPFRNHLSASKYGYKKASPTCPPLPSLPPPPYLSTLPFLFTKVSLFWSSRCVFRCIFQGRSFQQSRCVFPYSKVGRFSLNQKVGRFVSFFKVSRFFQQSRCVVSVFEGRSFRSKSQGGSFRCISRKVGRFSSTLRWVVSFISKVGRFISYTKVGRLYMQR